MNFVDNKLNPKTGTIRGRAVFDNKDGLFTPGFFGRLRLFGGENNALLIPDSAIASDQSRKIVFAVADDGGGTKRSSSAQSSTACASSVRASPLPIAS